METITTKQKIQAWLDGAKDYQEGKKLLESIPEANLVAIQLCHIETYQSRMMIYKAFSDILSIEE